MLTYKERAKTGFKDSHFPFWNNNLILADLKVEHGNVFALVGAHVFLPNLS